MKSLALEQLKETITAFTTVQCEFLAENCIVALEENEHTSGCKLAVSGDKVATFTVEWTKKVSRAGYQEPIKFTEKAAEAVAFLLTPHLTGYTVIKEARIGTGVDYWLGYDKQHELYDPENFLKGQMEVSGILNETAGNTVEKRVAEKKQRFMNNNRPLLPIYISVIEFSAPKAFYGKI